MLKISQRLLKTFDFILTVQKFHGVQSIQRPKHPQLESLIPKQSLNSLSDAIAFHEHAHYRREMIKGYFTSDQQTLNIVRHMLNQCDEKDFLTDLILSPPNMSCNEEGSRHIIFAPIKNFPQHLEQYMKLREKQSLVTIGGPAALDTSLIASLMNTTKLFRNVHISGPFKESNLAYSALQLHVRHGTALNAEADLTGHALLFPFIVRNTLGLSIENILDPDFLKIDIKVSNLTLKKVRIYLGNEINWLSQMIRQRLGLLTEHDLNRFESTFSQDVLHYIENKTQVPFSSNANMHPKDSISIHVDLTHSSSEKTAENNELILRTADVESCSLTDEEKKFFFGDQHNNVIHATRYPNDGCLFLETQRKKIELLLKNGGESQEKYVTHILFAGEKQEKIHVAGVVTNDEQFIYASHVHVSPGYKAKFQFGETNADNFVRNIFNRTENMLQLSPPVPGHRLTVATGVSVNALMRNTKHLQKIIDKYGTTPQFAVTNSHWTLLSKDSDYLLMRVTGGGNTGSETYNPAYFLNLIANTRRIFGNDTLVGIVSSYGCPRSINARNSTEFFKAANVFISYGKGGTGNTKRHAEAILALQELGFSKDVEIFLGNYTNYKGKRLSETAEFLSKKVREMGFVVEDDLHFSRRLGHSNQLSNKELMFICAVILIFTGIIFY